MVHNKEKYFVRIYWQNCEQMLYWQWQLHNQTRSDSNMNLFKEIQCDSGTKPMSVYLCEAKMLWVSISNTLYRRSFLRSGGLRFYCLKAIFYDQSACPMIKCFWTWKIVRKKKEGPKAKANVTLFLKKHVEDNGCLKKGEIKYDEQND